MMRDQISRYYISQSMTRMANLIKAKGCFKGLRKLLYLITLTCGKHIRITPQGWIMFKKTYNYWSTTNF